MVIRLEKQPDAQLGASRLENMPANFGKGNIGWNAGVTHRVTLPEEGNSEV